MAALHFTPNPIFNPSTTGNPFWGKNYLELVYGRVRAQGLTPLQLETRLLATLLAEISIGGSLGLSRGTTPTSSENPSRKKIKTFVYTINHLLVGEANWSYALTTSTGQKESGPRAATITRKPLFPAR